MEVHFTADQEAQVSEIASHAGLDPENWVKSIALRSVEETTLFCAAVREGLVQADRGELVDDEKVRAWLELRNP